MPSRIITFPNTQTAPSGIPRAAVTLVGPGGPRGRRARFSGVLVDTGATHSQLPESVARNLGLDPAQGQTRTIMTSNGRASRWLLTVELVVQGIRLPAIGVYFGANVTPLVGRSAIYAAFLIAGFERREWLWSPRAATGGGHGASGGGGTTIATPPAGGPPAAPAVVQRLASALTREHEIALGFVLTDPRAAEVGAATYPLHQQLGWRLRSEARATLVLEALVTAGLLEHVDVARVDRHTDEWGSYPAYRVTATGMAVAASNDSVRQFREHWVYYVHLAGPEAQNEPALEAIKGRMHVDTQTRFITSDDAEVSLIKIWAYEPLAADDITALAEGARARVLAVYEKNC
jgi:predicted aspartyl protease